MVDLNEYKFFNGVPNNQTKEFTQKLINIENQQKSINKNFIKHLLMQFIYIQLMDQVNSQVESIKSEFKDQDLPHIFQENKSKWCSLIVKSPQIQNFHNQFTESLYKLLSVELENN